MKFRPTTETAIDNSNDIIMVYMMLYINLQPLLTDIQEYFKGGGVLAHIGDINHFLYIGNMQI